MKNICLFFIASLMLIMCGKENKEKEIKVMIAEKTIKQVIDSLEQKFGELNQQRINEGVRNVASFWNINDGNDSVFVKYCLRNFIGNSTELDSVFHRISENFEIVNGSFNAINVGLQRRLNLDLGEIMHVDEAFATYNPSTHFTDDFFENKIAFLILLNFPNISLDQKEKIGEKWSRKEWAYARMGDIFDSRVPASVNQLVVNANTRAEMYIADYNIFAGKLVNDEGKTLFPKDMKLLSHWNIRDEIKTNYGKPDGLPKQKMLYEVMKRIVTQEIPQEVINSPKYNWNPYNNKVFDNSNEIAANQEASVRFDVLLQFFRAQQKVDEYYPKLDTYIKRNFESGMEVPLNDIEELFKSYLSSSEVKKVADVIKKRLGRDLEPFDIWYDGFKSRSLIPAEELDRVTQVKYPNREAVQNDLPLILTKLDFSKEKAISITDKIQVDPARGSGHAWEAKSKDQKSLLRTRIFANGMDYKGYNIAIHEFGHNVEQTISLYDVDYYMLRGVPNTAFTEALAFLFQKNDLKLLGFKETDVMQEYYNNLDLFWQLYEIMGVSLVDINTWKWLYENPDARPIELKDAVNGIAKDIWNKYYAPVFGISDEPVLAIYSHMINAPLYLSNYAYGHIIEFQLSEYLKNKDFADEIERIFSQGKLTPQQWMLKATGSKTSVQSILNSVNIALTKI